MRTIIINFILMLFLSASAYSQKKPFTIETLYKVKYLSSPILSPEGNKICFLNTEYDLHKGKSSSDLYLINQDGSGLENLTGSRK